MCTNLHIMLLYGHLPAWCKNTNNTTVNTGRRNCTEWRDMFGTSTYHFPTDSNDPILPSHVPSAALPLSEEIANSKSPIPIPVTDSVPDPAPSSDKSPKTPKPQNP